MPAVVTALDLPLPRFGSGKVRETFDLGEQLLMVTTDRISAFDVIFAEGIPYKGEILNRLSTFWLTMTRDIIPNHLVTINPPDFPEVVQPYSNMLAGRAMIVKKAQRIDFECVVRGYLAGSGWKDYQSTGMVSGHVLPPGRMRLAERLPEPIFTPAFKNDHGHDENCTVAEMANRIGIDLTETIQRISIELYQFAAAVAIDRGIIIADTKFEFGLLNGELLLIDEVLTPDSSRFWTAGLYEPGTSPASFDKQYLRDWLEASGWNKTPPPPALPAGVIEGTTSRYQEAFEWLTGDPFFSMSYE